MLTVEKIVDALAYEREELSALRNDVEGLQKSLAERLSTAGKALTTLANEKAELQRERYMLQTSLADKARVETELRAELASRANVDSKQQAIIQSASTSNDEAQREIARLNAELAEANKAAREAARASAVAVAGGSSAAGRESRELQAMLDQRTTEIAGLREHIETQARSHSTQLAELQDSCQAKLKQMRDVHEQQLLDARTATKPADEPPLGVTISVADMEQLRQEHKLQVEEMKKAHLAEVASLKSDLEKAEAHASQGLESAMNMTDKFKARAEQAEAAERRARGEASQTSTRVAKLQSVNEELTAKVGSLESALQVAQSSGGSSVPGEGGSGGGGMDMEALNIMELQLVKLSDRLRVREQEAIMLQATVTEQCEERRELKMALAQAHAALQQQQQQQLPHQPMQQMQSPVKSDTSSGGGIIGGLQKPPSSPIRAYYSGGNKTKARMVSQGRAFK